MARDEKLEHLKGVPLFARMGHHELERLGQLADEVEVGLDSVLTEQGQTGHEFFFVLDGRLMVLDGHRPIATLGPGDFFGEIALIAKTPRNATITTTSPVRALVITDRAFRQLLEHSPKIQIGVLTALAERLAPTSL